MMDHGCSEAMHAASMLNRTEGQHQQRTCFLCSALHGNTLRNSFRATLRRPQSLSRRTSRRNRSGIPRHTQLFSAAQLLAGQLVEQRLDARDGDAGARRVRLRLLPDRPDLSRTSSQFGHQKDSSTGDGAVTHSSVLPKCTASTDNDDQLPAVLLRFDQ
jgi:hypothetical protein